MSKPSRDDSYDLIIVFSGAAEPSPREVPAKRVADDLAKALRVHSRNRQLKTLVLDLDHTDGRGTEEPSFPSRPAIAVALLSGEREAAARMERWFGGALGDGKFDGVFLVELSRAASEIRPGASNTVGTVTRLWRASTDGDPAALTTESDAYASEIVELAWRIVQAMKRARARDEPVAASAPPPAMSAPRPTAAHHSSPAAGWDEALAPLSVDRLRDLWRGDPKRLAEVDLAPAYAPRSSAQATPAAAPEPASARMPPPMSAPAGEAGARRSVRLWKPLAAIGAAAAVYFLLRSCADAAIFGLSLIKSMVVPAARSSSGTDVVDVSAFAPFAVTPREKTLLQVFLHKPEDAPLATKRALAADPRATERGVATLQTEIAFGQRVDVVVESPDLTIDEPRQTLVWRGTPAACQFFVSTNAGPGLAVAVGVRLFVGTVPVGSLRFMLAVVSVAQAADRELRNRGDNAGRYRRAFLSYAAPDRAEVLKRAQGIRAAGLTFFQDVLSVDPGERWERRLYEEIDRCDLFLLFWSSHAQKSEWVMREADYALSCRARSPNERPDLQPVIIEGPPPPTPPRSLAHLHFNDPINYAIAIESKASGRA